MVNMQDAGTPVSIEGQGVNLRELLFIALKRRRIVISAVAVVTVLAALYSFVTVPMYTATGQILIEREPNILSFENIFQIETFSDDYYQTQYKILQSRALAGDTIDRMRLLQAKVMGQNAPKTGEGQPATLAEDTAGRRAHITQFLDNLSIRPVKKTRLVQATFSDPNPQTAAQTLNTFFEAYIEMNLQKKYQATEQAGDFLATQITNVRTEIETLETRLQDYGKEKNIIALSNSENTVIGKLGEMNKALTDAQIDRINKETYYNEIRDATVDNIPGTLNNPLVQKLAEEYNRLYRDYVKRSETFLPDFPEIQSLKAELDQAKKALEEETKAVIGRAYTDFQAAQAREQALAAAFNSQRREAFQLNSNAIQYNSLLIQIQNAKSLLESLMTRKSEADVSSRLKGFKTSNIWIVDRAEVPNKPSGPKKGRNIALGFLVGLFGGLSLALLFENLDVTLKTAEDVQKSVGLQTLGMVPEFSKNMPWEEPVTPDEKDSPAAGQPPRQLEEEVLKGLRDIKPDRKSRLGNGGRRRSWPKSLLDKGRFALGLAKPVMESRESRAMDLIVHFSPKSPFAEYFRSIRTTMLLSGTGPKMRLLAITSPMPQEGKTVTACNLAVAIAQTGRKVLLIDADLRKPRVHEIFRFKNLNGLTKYLAADIAEEDLLHATAIPTLHLINSGPIPPNPLELLGSDKMGGLIERMSARFDIVLVDTPPVLAVSDSLILGARLDGAIIVVRAGQTPRDALRRAYEKLNSHKIKSLGVIINGAKFEDFDEYHISSYYEYRGRTEL